MKIFSFLTVLLFSWGNSFASTNDSLLYFADLTQKIDIKHPKPRNEEYEIRLWVKTALAYGDAQELYVIHQKKNRLTLKQYFFYSQKTQYLKHIVTFKASIKDTSLWSSLTAHDVLTLPNGTEIVRDVFKEEGQKMRQFRDTTRVEIINDSIRVVGRRSRGKQMIVLDGTSYYFEIFCKNTFHKYAYHCPATYSHAYPQKKEFEKANTIIQLIFRAFRDYDKKICRQYSKSHHHNARIQRRKNTGTSSQFNS
ncbi:hypothetical protein GVN20_09960 [Runella sp. CRIBMP]|uniref:hypothetical protein n=1 Tax=Runella sp. CRIBMP TaxID=2683261 RepID=UPI001412C868|nr:hypothetical protein [Runella sp. CRIBMP]NBB19675.1 hypothetical protein [Runella sp. CRIBMP]